MVSIFEEKCIFSQISVAMLATTVKKDVILNE